MVEYKDIIAMAHVCLSQVEILTKQLNRLSSFWYTGFLRLESHFVVRKLGHLEKNKHRPSPVYHTQQLYFIIQ